MREILKLYIEDSFLIKLGLLIVSAIIFGIAYASASTAAKSLTFHAHFPAFPSSVCTKNVLRHDNQMQMDYCAYAAYQNADNILNKRYKDLMSSGRYPLVIAAEVSWIKYRNKWCRSVINNVRGGSIEPVVKYDCLTRLTEEQSNNIKREFGLYYQTDKATTNSGKYKKIVIKAGKYYVVPKGYEWVIKDQKRIPCGRVCTSDLYVKGDVFIGKGAEYSVNNGNFSGLGGHISISFNKKQRSPIIILSGSRVQVGDSEQRIITFQERTKKPSA